ncbi:MAG TPA: hypothetical protein VND22_00300, partial [Actinomycetota bacterium]|nr:hypothetical protein [Actinomycetota bacterium]
PYELGVLEHGVFQSSPPHTWQAWRLARYFGRGDRGYRVVGLIRPPGAQGDAIAAVTAMRMSERDIDLIDSVLPVPDAVAALRARKPEAVIVAGTPVDLEQVVAALGSEGTYAGRGRIKNGWRPQLAGFESTWGANAPAGTVIASDYAVVWRHSPGVVGPDPVREAAGKIETKDGFATLFELRGYEAARVLLEGASRAGAGSGPLASGKRGEIRAGIEAFDRVRLGRLPVSFGPDDRVIAERDHMGLWAAVADPSAGSLFQPLMRTFTSDLERTNVLEEDWPYFFEGAVPGAEAPFFHQSRFGIVTDKSDDLH